MPKNTSEPCSSCGRATPTDRLVAKKSDFRERGSRGRVLRTRTVAHLCETCLADDADWQLEKLPAFTARSATR